MIINIDTHGGVPIYRQVMDQVKRLIMTGQLADGEQLESVKSLSTRLKVNPMTISKAYSFLVQEGLVERRRGVGLFVTTMEGDSKKHAKTEMLTGALENAVSMAVQMGIGKEKALGLFEEYFDTISARKGRTSE